MYVGGRAYGIPMALSEDDFVMLRFEAEHPGIGAAKNEAIRSQLLQSPIRYYQKLSRLADSVEALQFDPVLVHRIRRIREQQQHEREHRVAPR